MDIFPDHLGGHNRWTSTPVTVHEADNTEILSNLSTGIHAGVLTPRAGALLAKVSGLTSLIVRLNVIDCRAARTGGGVAPY